MDHPLDKEINQLIYAAFELVMATERVKKELVEKASEDLGLDDDDDNDDKDAKDKKMRNSTPASTSSSSSSSTSSSSGKGGAPAKTGDSPSFKIGGKMLKYADDEVERYDPNKKEYKVIKAGKSYVPKKLDLRKFDDGFTY